MENLESHSIICEGGWNSNQNYLLLSQRFPGQATTLINFEPSLFGGYRKISGFTPLEATDSGYVDSAGAEGKIYTVAFYNGDIIAARKTVAPATVYKFYKYVDGAVWDDYVTGLTLTATNVDKIRWDTYNFDGTEGIAFVDGVNGMTLFNGTAWIDVGTADTGADFANAGGVMALTNPKYVTLFKNHIFCSGASATPNIIAHSAPNAEYDWTVASGAGQLIAGFVVKQIKPFRDELYVFGENQIKKIVVENDAFVLKDVTTKLGCLSPDSVVEFNGDLLFLSQDGFRTIAATDRVGDLEIAVQSKNIQQDVIDLIEDSADLSQVTGTIIRRKSQVRFLFSDDVTSVASTVGILGGIRGGHETEHTGTNWEWSKLVGIRASCTASDYIGTQEYVIHGDYNGKVYRQETGDDFDGANILCSYTTPYFDLGDVFVRKNIHKIIIFVRAEGETALTTIVKFDWGDDEVSNPESFLLETSTTGTTYGTGVYDTSTYATTPQPLLIKNVNGSGFSFSMTFTSDDAGGSYSIQAIVIEFATNGRK